MNLWFKLHSSPSQDRVSPQANAHVHRSRERGTQPGGRSPTAGGERGPGLTGASATEGHAHLGAWPPACRATPLWESRGGSSATEGHAHLGAGPLLRRATPIWGRVLSAHPSAPAAGRRHQKRSKVTSAQSLQQHQTELIKVCKCPPRRLTLALHEH
ncbi:unnamed protein product [Gadus morhua 'NCC']